MECNDSLIYIIDKAHEFADEDLGKKKLQKLIYLIENIGDVPLGYEYIIHLYGPFSESLDDDIRGLTRDGFLEYEQKNSFYTVDVTISGRNELSNLSLDYESQIENVLKIFGSKSPSDLELITTTHYVKSSLEDTVEDQTVKNVVGLLNGGKFSKDDIQNAIDEIRRTCLTMSSMNRCVMA